MDAYEITYAVGVVVILLIGFPVSGYVIATDKRKREKAQRKKYSRLDDYDEFGALIGYGLLVGFLAGAWPFVLAVGLGSGTAWGLLWLWTGPGRALAKPGTPPGSGEGRE